MRGVPQVPEAEAAVRKGRVLAWVSIAYICSTIAMLFMVMSGSQALKTEMSGELLSLIPPTLFLIGDKVSRREPNERYPFGYERAVSAGYVGAAVALFLVGAYLLFDGGMKLAMKEHPTIGGYPLLGHVVWTGWLGIAVLVWSSVPAFFLGRAKRRAAKTLHDKTLAADAEINTADWQSAAAAMLGIIGVGFGLWWADSLAGVLISLEIIRSGWSELRTALGDIMDSKPQEILSKEDEKVPAILTDYLRAQPWVKDVVVRVRERGREFTADAHVVPASDEGLVDRISETSAKAREFDPRLAELTIAAVREFPDDVKKARGPVPGD
ncbi:cation diffusion facilitator family transporter [Sphingomonas sp. F9_3S_D5_B_2]